MVSNLYFTHPFPKHRRRVFLVWPFAAVATFIACAAVAAAPKSTSRPPPDDLAALISAYDHAEAAIDRAWRYQASADPADAQRFFKAVPIADWRWARVEKLMTQVEKHRVALPPSLELHIELTGLLLRARWGMPPPAAATELRRILRGDPKLGYALSVQVALLANLGAEMEGPGWTAKKNAKGILVLGHKTPAPSPRLSRLDRLLCVRYELRALRSEPQNPTTAFLLMEAPLPPTPGPYEKLNWWGLCYFAAHWRAAKEWYRYSRHTVSYWAQDAEFNVKVNSLGTLIAIEAGKWHAPLPHLPTWAEVKKAMATSKKK